ncbi:MAG: single-stranded-DNA-specific exonuclease RecJ [Nitrospirae bacterium]|nr:single-stranded-DNA-specific exonuclease RecJ [Nitrospirota bacterium]
MTDHHEPPQILPEAYAIVNPTRVDSLYPFKDLAGVGVALKLAQGVLQGFKGSRIQGFKEIKEFNDPVTSWPLDPILYKYLDLVALGTVADISSLTGENRKLIKEGLKLLSKADRKGIAALKIVSNLDGSDISVGTIGFTLAPRINAAGRLDEANVGVMLLTTASEEEAIKCAKILDGKNRERQMIEDKILNEAIEMIDSEIDIKHTNAIVLSSDKWHQGVIGIIASKIVDRYYRPAILISVNENGIGKGSARSIPNFHLYQGLSECQSYLEAFGGHKYAAGLSIRKENIAPFSERINEVAAPSLKKEDFIPKLYIDGELNVKELNFNLLKEIERLEPFGVGNPEPVFAITDAEVLYPKIVGSNHLKFKLRQGNAGADAIGFNMGEFVDRLNDEKVDVAVTPKLNEWQGTLAVQMKIKDIKFPGN